MRLFSSIWKKGKAPPSGEEERIESTILFCETGYAQNKKTFPAACPHQHLIAIKLNMRAMTEPDLWVRLEKDEDFKSTTLYYEGIKTRVCACVPPTTCARALAYTILFDTEARSTLIGTAKYHVDYLSLMKPVYHAFKTDGFRDLYCSYNRDPQHQSFYADRELSFEECLYFLSEEEIEKYAKMSGRL